MAFVCLAAAALSGAAGAAAVGDASAPACDKVSFTNGTRPGQDYASIKMNATTGTTAEDCQNICCTDQKCRTWAAPIHLKGKTCDNGKIGCVSGVVNKTKTSTWVSETVAAAAAAAAANTVPVAATGAPSPPLECGVGSAVFETNTGAITTAINTNKMKFWWNWDIEYLTTTDTTGLDPAVLQKLQDAFVPMLWGSGSPSDFDFLKDHDGDVMGFNEPDMYGPACCNCDGKQTYKPASSSGWAPLFNPSSASTAWQATLKLLTSIPHTAGGIQRVVSPAMANGATAQPGVDCSADPAVDNNPHTCQGWMAMFKNFTLKLPCQDMATGKTTNCWDAMDAINIHAYSRTAQEVKAKISGYYDVFKEDFEGLNGRTKKTLWLTEVAMASNKPAEISQFMTELLNGKDGLGNRAPASAGGF
eukprot:gene4060-9990_t